MSELSEQEQKVRVVYSEEEHRYIATKLQNLSTMREDRKRDEARCLHQQRELQKALHEYELARLDLNAIEKRRALAESQLEQLCRVNDV